jgi:hypothetical protein
MTAPPLTHHEIVRLAEPFARAGRHVDLAASDRALRRLAFKAIEVDPGVPDLPPLRETLRLEAAPDVFGLRRELSHPAGLTATLEARGPDAGALLAQVQAVPPARQFGAGPGYLVACSHALASPGRGGASAPGESLVLRQGVVRVDGLTLTLTLRLPDLRGVAGDIELVPAPDEAFDLPEDLLAVQGWDWARLVRRDGQWTSKLRLRGAVLRRSRTAERALEQVARHLVRVLAEPPAQFHRRHRLARWGVVFRRGIPSLTALSMIGGALALAKFGDGELSGVWLALHYAPIALLALAFSLQELPQFEIPPLPRRAKAPDWRREAGGGAAPEREPARM